MKSNLLIVFSVSTIITVLLLLLSPVRFDKYLVEKIRSHPSKGAESIAFADMNGDGRDDFFECAFSNLAFRRNSCVCRSFTENGLLTTALEEFNVPNLIYSPVQIQFSDFNSDGNMELWLLSADNEEIYLYGFEGPNLNAHKYRLYLDSAKAYEGNYSLSYKLGKEFDFNQDGQKELLFHIRNGFPIYPRRNYLVDLENENIIKSPATSANFMAIDWHDLGGGKFVASGVSGSSGNHKDTVNLPYPDTQGYAFAFDEELNFLFDPIPITQYPNGVNNYLLDTTLISVASYVVGKNEMIIEARDFRTGTVIDSTRILGTHLRNARDERFLILSSDNRILKMNHHLKIVDEFQTDFHIGTFAVEDLDGDGHNEFLIVENASNKTHVLDHTFSHLIDVPDEFFLNKFQVRRDKYDPDEFVSLSKDEVNYYTYSANPFYWFRFPYYFVVFGATYLITFFLFKTYRKNIENRFQKERELNRLQLLSLKNQIDPHFALNALNSIDWMYKQKEHEKASRFMETYSRLVHQTVKSSDQIAVKLFEELSFCRKFCELEKMRDQEFDYSVKVDEEVDTFEIEIPRQLIFTHVENAVKHGLRPKDGDKKLKIEVIKEGEDLWLIVENNGLTYQKKSSTSGTSKGLEIHQQLIDIYRDLKKVNISSEIGPCADGSGTCVKMLVKDLFRPTH
ncbi:MAG: histidine kinase [Bacteroidota bacterium]